MKRPVTSRLRLHDVRLSYVHLRGILGVWGNIDYSKESISGGVEEQNPPGLNAGYVCLA